MKQREPKPDIPKPEGEEEFTVSAWALMIWRLAVFCCGGFLATAPLPVVFQLVGLMCMIVAVVGD